jgi:hypothetical protein
LWFAKVNRGFEKRLLFWEFFLGKGKKNNKKTTIGRAKKQLLAGQKTTIGRAKKQLLAGLKEPLPKLFFFSCFFVLAGSQTRNY